MRFNRAFVLPVLTVSMLAANAVRAADPTPAPTPGASTDAGKQEEKAPGKENGTQSAAPHPDAATAKAQSMLVEQGEFSEQTKVHGKIDADLTGVWLLVATANLAPDRYKTFPQLIRVTKEGDSLHIHLLDVELPKSAQMSLKEANEMKLSFWAPDDDLRTTLSTEWSKLPRVKQKALDDPLFAKIDYVVAAPDQYASALKRGGPVDALLNGTVFGMQVIEDYKPRQLPPDARISQLMQRRTVYGAKSVEKNLIKGDQHMGFLAMGAGNPIPIQLSGTFVMYRIASPS